MNYIQKIGRKSAASMKEFESHSHLQSGQPKNASKKFTLGPIVPDYKIEHCDVDRAVKINDGPIIRLKKSEYQLLMLILEHMQEDYVSYTEIAQHVYECEFDEDLLLTIRKRVSAVRRKMADYGIDIISIPRRGYKACSLNGLVVPYRRGYRARKT